MEELMTRNARLPEKVGIVGDDSSGRLIAQWAVIPESLPWRNSKDLSGVPYNFAKEISKADVVINTPSGSYSGVN